MRPGTVTTAPTNQSYIGEPPTRYTATNLTPGCHVFSVLGTDAQGNLRPSDPKMVVVRSQ